MLELQENITHCEKKVRRFRETYYSAPPRDKLWDPALDFSSAPPKNKTHGSKYLRSKAALSNQRSYTYIRLISTEST